MKAKKIITVTANGQVTRHESPKPSADSRIKQLLADLGMNAQEFHSAARMRMFTRMAGHKYLGIGS
jgi:hypothetical protein